MAFIEIGGRKIGDGFPCYLIAEIGINHNGSFGLAKTMIEVAANCGVDAVKLQKRNMEQLYRKSVLDDPNSEGQSFQYLIPVLKQVELTDENYRALVQIAAASKAEFLCTPWDRQSVDFLEELGVKAFKIASADLTNMELLAYAASKNKPLLVSTGMASLDEVDKSVEFLKSRGAQFVLLHCNSTYPCAFKDVNLKVIQLYKERYGVPVGYSGHERGVIVSTVAAALGACVIERHFTLDRTMQGPDHAASIEPQGFAKMVKYIRATEESMGDGKKRFTRGEGLIREVLGKSVVSACAIPTGTVITREMLTVKSPGKGISPQRLDDIVGKTAKKDIVADADIQEGDF